MSTIDKKIYEQVYNVNSDVTLTSQVASVVCLLARRGVMTAGFNAAGELLIIHYNGYNHHKPVWALDFYEQLFAQDPLLGAKDKIKGVFISTDKFLLVPAALYHEKDATEWLKHIHFMEPGDTAEPYSLGSKLPYLHAIPVYIPELIKINFKKAAKLPLSTYQFNNIPQTGAHVQCCLLQEQACIMLHNDGNLLWHQVIDYTTAEDIAYEVKHFCAANGLDAGKITVACNAVSATEYPVIAELSRYFVVSAGNGNAIRAPWDGAISLAKQLRGCV